MCLQQAVIHGLKNNFHVHHMCFNYQYAWSQKICLFIASHASLIWTVYHLQERDMFGMCLCHSFSLSALCSADWESDAMIDLVTWISTSHLKTTLVAVNVYTSYLSEYSLSSKIKIYYKYFKVYNSCAVTDTDMLLLPYTTEYSPCQM